MSASTKKQLSAKAAKEIKEFLGVHRSFDRSDESKWALCWIPSRGAVFARPLDFVISRNLDAFRGKHNEIIAILAVGIWSEFKDGIEELTRLHQDRAECTDQKQGVPHE